MTEKKKEKVNDLGLWGSTGIWILRIGVGSVFIMSGFVKAIDIWGVVFKFEEYFTSWQIEVPSSLSVMGAMALSSLEFVLGCLLLLGCFRRTVVWALMAMMAVMLPLTLYVWIKDPVPDCGCFGDFIILSNGATFLKNIVLVAALAVLIVYNKRVACLFHPYSQWLCGVACLVFVTLVELFGFNVQPMIDFRSFPEGTSLLVEEEDDASDSEFEFIYSHDGEERAFRTDSLPDSSWVFVDRRLIGGNLDTENKTELLVTDEDGEDITGDIISGSGPEMLVVVPQAERADMFYTSFTNDLNSVMNRLGGSLIELTDVAADSIDSMRDYFMAEYSIYHAESTVLKELSRGVVSVVMLKDGVISWKRNMGSIDVEKIAASDNPAKLLDDLYPDGAAILKRWVWMLGGALLGILMLDKLLCLIINRRKNGEGENKCVNLHDESRISEDETSVSDGKEEKSTNQ